MPGKVKHLKETTVDGITYKVGEKVPLPKKKLVVLPAGPTDNRPSFQPCRGKNK